MNCFLWLAVVEARRRKNLLKRIMAAVAQRESDVAVNVPTVLVVAAVAPNDSVV